VGGRALIGLAALFIAGLMVATSVGARGKPSAPPGKPDTAPTTTPTPTSTTTAGPTPPPVSGSWTLKFADEFNGSSLDLNKWRPNWAWWLTNADTVISKPVNEAELSCYDPSAVTESNGVVTLTAVQQPCTANNGVTYAYRSGLIESYNHYQFTYGYMEARMWLPQGTDSPVDWPAFWANGVGT